MLEALLFLIHHLPWHRQLPQFRQIEDPISAMMKVVSGLLLRVLSMAADLNLFKEEIGWKGEVGGERKATEGHGHLGHSNVPATPPSPLPQPTTGHRNSGSCSRQARPSGRLAWVGIKVRWLQGWLHGQQQVAKMPQQEYGQRVAGMLQEYQGWVKMPQE